MATPTAHSQFSPSSSARWLSCPASVREIERLISEDPDADGGSSIAADTGSVAHDFVDRILRSVYEGEKIDWPAGTPTPEWIRRFLSDTRTFEGCDPDNVDWADMYHHAMGYVRYCADRMEECSENATPYVERRYHMPRISPIMFGTGDFAIIDPERRHGILVDLKYGFGHVEAAGNTQLLCYGEGLANLAGEEFGVELATFEVHIYQPRTHPANIAKFEFTRDRLDLFVADAAEAIQLASTDNPPFGPSPKACQWCPVRGECKARSDDLHEALRGDFEDLDDALYDAIDNPNRIDDATLGAWICRADDMRALLKDLEKEAVKRALSGETIPGTKVVRGRSAYKIDDGILEFVLGPDAFREIPATRKPLTRTDLKRNLGTQRFDELLSGLYDVVPGTIKVVAVTDRRPAHTSGNPDDFEDLND